MVGRSPALRDRKLVLWLALLGGAASLLACAAAGALWLFASEREERAPRAAAHSYMLDVRQGRRDDALRRMVPSYQLAHDARTFANALDHAPALALHTGAEIEAASVGGDAATVDAELSGPSGVTPIRFELRRLDGHWYIERVLVGDIPVG